MGVKEVSVTAKGSGEEINPDNTPKMSTLLEPQSYVSEKKSFGEYKKDLLRWSRLTSLDKKVQSEMVVYQLEGDPSRIKAAKLNELDTKLVLTGVDYEKGKK